MNNMENSKKVSIVIPTYNSEYYLIECLDSAINQTYKNIEIIVVDDESSDGTVEMVKKYIKDHPTHDIKLFEIKHADVGVVRNHGWSKATGDYIAFLDSDDAWFGKKLEHQMKIIIENDLDMFSSTSTTNIDAPRDLDIVETEMKYSSLFSNLIKTHFHTSDNVVSNRIKERFGLSNCAEDQLLWCRILSNPAYKCAYDDSIVAFYRTTRDPKAEKPLSDNQKKMFKEGILKNLKVLRKEKRLSSISYLFLRTHATAKYIFRRIFGRKIFQKKK